jgi:signal transduction histidine kinase
MNLNAAIEASRANIHFDNLPIVPADEDRMSQVFQNLIANAIKYCKPGRVPELAIKAVEKEREFMFCFTDKGIGIERATANSAFDFFKRLTNSKKQEGSGVGLAVCKRIVEGHGGKIWIDSEPGVGTTVNFSLPKQAVSVGSSA